MGEIIAGNFVQVIIDGVDRTSHVVSYTRFSDLCEIGASFTLILSSDYPVTLNPYQSIVITEDYDGTSGPVLRGYIIDINQDFDGEFNIVGQDKSILLFDHFISDQIKSTGESVDFWIQFYANEVGLTVEFQASASNTIVEEGTLMGLQTAGEGILTLERLAAYFIRFDSILDKLIAFRLGDSEPVITVSSVIDAKRQLGTENTRNIVKVYGGFRFSVLPEESPIQLFAKAQSDIPELLVDKTVVINSPSIRKQAFLDIIVNRILGTVNSVDDLQYYSIPELLPNLKVGQIAEINITHSPHINYQGDRKITSLEIRVDNNGAITIIGVGAKCERISIQFPIPPVYATTTTDGVTVSFDGGDNFKPSNTGLAGSGLIGQNIAVNSFGQQMVLTAAGIFRRSSVLQSWILVDNVNTLPNPINDSNDQPSGVAATNLDLIRIVDEPTNRNNFHLMSNGTSLSGNLGRSWIYTTSDFGNNWTSTQLYIPDVVSGQDHPFAPSGLSYDVYGHDLFGGIDNNVFALVTSTADLGVIFTPTFANAFYNISLTAGNTKTFRVFDRDGNFVTKGFPVGLGLTKGLVSVPRDRTIVYVLRGSNLFRSKDSGDSWTDLGTFNDQHTMNEGLYVDWGSLSDGETVKIIGMGEQRVPLAGDSQGFITFVIATDNINTDIIDSKIQDSVQYPNMEKDLSDADENNYTVGQNLRVGVTDNDNWYSGPAGGQAAIAGGRFISTGPLAGAQTRRPVYTTKPSGGNAIYYTSLAIVLPDSPFIAHYNLPYMNIFVVKIDIDAGTGSMWSNTRFEAFTIDSGVFEGPDASSDYPSSPGDGENYGINIKSVISTAVAFGLEMHSTPIGADYVTFAKFYPMTASTVGITNPSAVIDFSAAGGDGQWTVEARYAEQSLTGGDGKRTGVLSGASNPDNHVDGVFASDTFANGNGTDGEVIQMGTSATLSRNKYYQVIRTGWDSSEPSNQQGEYNVYEGSGSSTSPTAMFAGHIDSVAEQESSDFTSHNTFWDIAEELEE